MGDLILLLIIAPMKFSGWFIYWLFTGKEALGWIRFTESVEYELAGRDDWRSLYGWMKKINDKRRLPA